jgi:hypothetical protein
LTKLKCRKITEKTLLLRNVQINIEGYPTSNFIFKESRLHLHTLVVKSRLGSHIAMFSNAEFWEESIFCAIDFHTEKSRMNFCFHET